MKFPLPELQNRQFTMNQYPKADAPKGTYKLHHFIDNGECCACGKKHERTCRVEGMPNLCKNCYSWMVKYSYMDDPYRMAKLPKGKVIEPELIKKAIRYAKVGKLQSGLTLTAIALAVLKRLRK